MNSFCFVIFVHNGGRFLWYSLKNLLEICVNSDSFILAIEGYDNFRDLSELENDGSVDGTLDIVKSFHSEKIEYLKLGHIGDRRHLKNAAITRAGETDYIFFLETDEILDGNTFSRIVRRISGEDTINVRIKKFFGDLFHKCPDSNSEFEERIIKNMGGIGYMTWHNFVEVLTGGELRTFGRNLSLDVSIPNFQYVGSVDRINKERLRLIKEKNYYTKSVKSDPFWKEVDSVNYIKGFYPNNPGGLVFEGVARENLIPVEPDSLPEILRYHPFFGMNERNVMNSPTFPTIKDSTEIKIPVSNKRVLEIGSGPGLVLSLIGERYDVYGLDPSRFAVLSGRNRGLKMICSTVENAWFESGFFDAIYGIDALEHIKDPILAFKKFASWLKPGGILFLCCPNAEDSWTHDLKHFLWSPLQHFSIPTKRALENISGSNGFEILSLTEEGTNLWLKAVKARE